ncbi:hypothetical protein K457DRAFT_19043 [Linnemannia elongata AG-77]|uniref:Uncharacterized protein n=1 Tax=Linnemannia elongata AG-77 TaxID=1314771 RepID=A0A197JX54_9FUNG|nr:hypothetical protein K457DRAFT_19043 [Linnemannia elongata AG-77]
MGIPIELPSSPAPRSGPCHSAKPSWSSSAQQFPPSSSSSSSYSVSASSTSFSTSSSSSYSNPFPVVPPALSLARQQLLQDTRPPLTSLAYHPPPPHSQSLPSQQRTLSSHSSSVYGSYHSFPSPSPLLGSNGPSVDQSTWIQQARADVASASVPASASTTAAAVNGTEIQSPSPARAARPHPNLRRISRVPVFMTSPSGSGSGSDSGSAGAVNTLSVRTAPIASPTTSTFNNDYYSATMVRGTTVPTVATSSMESNMMVDSPPPASQPRPIWHPSSPSLVHYLTRPLPPLPRPTSTSSSTALHTVGAYPHQPQPYQQEQQEQPLLPQERTSWNYRFVNMNHADNHNRPETNTLSGSGMMHGYYYEDDRLRHDQSPTMRSYHHQQHYQFADSLSTGGAAAATSMTGAAEPADSSANANVTAFSSSSTSLLAPRPRPYYSMRGGSEVIDSDDIGEEEWIVQQQQQQSQQQQHLSERRSRHRPSLTNRERELHLQREQQHIHHHHLHHGQTTLSPLPLLSPTSPSSPSNSPSSSSNSSSSSASMTPIPSFLQGHPTVARTLIRADAFQQGVIHIYPENHAPIRMFGRPIITPTPPPLHTRSSLSSSSLTPRSSDAAAATLSSASLTESNAYFATVVDQGNDDDLTVHIPARPLATPPSSAGSTSSATILSTSSSIVLSPIPTLPPPAVTTTTFLSTQASQEIIETTPPSSTSRLGGEGIMTPPLARPPSAALSPVLTNGEVYRFSSSASSSIASPSSAGAYSGSPQTPPSSMSLALLDPPTMQVSRSQSVALSAEVEEDVVKEGFDEPSAGESHHHQHHRADHGAPLLSAEQEQERQQDRQPQVHPLEQFP